MTPSIEGKVKASKKKIRIEIDQYRKERGIIKVHIKGARPKVKA